MNEQIHEQTMGGTCATSLKSNFRITMIPFKELPKDYLFVLRSLSMDLVNVASDVWRLKESASVQVQDLAEPTVNSKKESE